MAKGKKGKGGKAPPPEVLDVRRYQIQASIAEERFNTLRLESREQKELLKTRTARLESTTQETDDLYTYLDSQMLTSARERQGYESRLRQGERKRKEELADMTQQMEVQQMTAADTIRELRSELKAKSEELDQLQEYRTKGPEREAEITRLKAELAQEEQERLNERSENLTQMYKLRKELNAEMYERIHQAKANFLDITGSMLDSTVHRTLLQNQHMQDEVAVMSQRVEDMVAANKSLLQQRQALRLELQLQQEMQQQQVQRALASRQLSRTVAEARAQDEEALQAARQQLAHSRTELQDRDDQVAKLQAQLRQAHRRVESAL